jgi:hypothetical protein
MLYPATQHVYNLPCSFLQLNPNTASALGKASNRSMRSVTCLGVDGLPDSGMRTAIVALSNIPSVAG